MTGTLDKERRAVLCFDAEYRVLFISSLAQDLVYSLFNCRPLLHEVLPDAVRACVVIMKRKGDIISKIEKSQLSPSLKQANATSVWVRLVPDNETKHHCLIFERERILSSPEQLEALGLSIRETEVTFWILYHKTSWEIGKILGISTRTVDKHVERIFSKLDVNNRSQLIEEARKRCDNF